jgi:hypothetical protein
MEQCMRNIYRMPKSMIRPYTQYENAYVSVVTGGGVVVGPGWNGLGSRDLVGEFRKGGKRGDAGCVRKGRDE